MAQRYADGYAADLTEAHHERRRSRASFDPALFGAATVDGKVVLVPHTADVTNVLWYNKPLLAEHGVTPPATWAELLAACDTLVRRGHHPHLDRQQGPVGGRQLAQPHGVARRGRGRLRRDPRRAASSPRPSGSRRSATSTQLVEHKCVNDSANAIDDNSGAQLFFQGKAAMHPIGSWLVSWAIDEAPELDFDFVNLPAMPDGAAGDQGSVIGVETGYIVNAKSPNIPLAVEFLALLNSPENVQTVHRRGGDHAARSRSGHLGDVDSRSARLQALLSGAPATVLPPDTGYDLKMANALYAAEAAVLGGQQSPADALAALDAAAGSLAGPRGRGARHRGARPARTLPHEAQPRLHARGCSCCPGCSCSGRAVLLPMAFTIGYSFTDWNGFGDMTWVGLDNYARALRDPAFTRRRSSTSSCTSRRPWSWRCWSAWGWRAWSRCARADSGSGSRSSRP